MSEGSGKVPDIEARIACFIAEDLRLRQLPVDGVLQDAGLTRRDLADPDARLPYRSVLKFLDGAVAVSGDASYALRLGASRDIRDRGILGFIGLNSPTLMEAINNLLRYRKVSGQNDEFEVERTGTQVTVRFREVNAALRPLRNHSDYLAGSMVRIARDLVRKRIVPVRMEFCHARPEQPVAYAEILDCPVEFEATWDALIFAEETTRLPIDAADDKLLRVLKSAGDRIVGSPNEKVDLVRDVEQFIVDNLHKGSVTLDNMAKALGLTSKTLERRLAAREKTFAGLLDDVRHRTARHFLEETDLRIFQIAYMVGYTEAAVLVRAVKRWTGLTPLEYRRAHNKAADPSA